MFFGVTVVTGFINIDLPTKAAVGEGPDPLTPSRRN